MKQLLVFLVVLLKLTLASNSHTFKHADNQVIQISRKLDEDNSKLVSQDEDYDTQDASNTGTTPTSTTPIDGTEDTDQTGTSDGSSDSSEVNDEEDSESGTNSTDSTQDTTGGSSSEIGSGTGSIDSTEANNDTETDSTSSTDTGLSSPDNDTVDNFESTVLDTTSTNTTDSSSNSTTTTETENNNTITVTEDSSSSDLNPITYAVAGLAVFCTLALAYLCYKIRQIEKNTVYVKPVGVELSKSAVDFRPTESVFVDMAAGFQIFDRRSDSVIINLNPGLGFDDQHQNEML